MCTTPTGTLTASRDRLVAGESLTLRWSLQNVETIVDFSGPGFAPAIAQDSQTFSPPAGAHTFTLRIKTCDAIVPLSASVQVDPAPEAPPNDDSGDDDSGWEEPSPPDSPEEQEPAPQDPPNNEPVEVGQFNSYDPVTDTHESGTVFQDPDTGETWVGDGSYGDHTVEPWP
ncbi:MAG: hypothetical protein HY554_00535 [Elusimicrobia bacterium]|nr:hypothetical protein [Elusimicrobiota bacterium]